MREYRYLLAQSTSTLSHIILWVSLLFFACMGTWAYYTELDEVTRGNGRVIPSSHVQIVQNLEGGIVAELLVQEGDIVEKNQVLMRIDDTRFATSFRESQIQQYSLLAKVARLRAEIEGHEWVLPADLTPEQRELYRNEQALAQSRQQEINSNIAVLQQQKQQKQHEINELQSRLRQLQNSYNLANKELDITRPLVKKGVMSEVDLLRLQREASELRGNLDATRSAIPRAEAALAEVSSKMTEVRSRFQRQAQTEFNEVEAELARLQESSLALEDRVARTAIRSPVKGTIKQIKVTTVGGVVQPGMDLIEIVPLEDTLLVEAQIRPADIAFLRPGQPAMVKFTAYDFSIFGGLKAELEHISADTIVNARGEAFFVIRLRTRKNRLGNDREPLPIIPGMTVTVDILTGKKTILDYILKPINKMQQNALRER